MTTTTPPSPRTPTSPISPISSTSMHTSASATPTSTTSLADSIWTQSTTPQQKSFLSELNSPTIRSPSNRSLPSPSAGKSFTERAQGFQGNFEGSSRLCDSTNGYKMTLSDDDLLYTGSGYAEYQAATDDMEIDSPIHGARRNACDESLNSPMLERILELLPRCLDSAATNEQPPTNADNHGHLTPEAQEQAIPTHQRSTQPPTRTRTRTRTTTRTRSPHSSRSTRSISRPRTESPPSSIAKPHNSSSTSIPLRYGNKQRTTTQIKSRHSPPPPTIKLHILPSKKSSHLQKSISHLSTRLVPLISVTTGQPHPGFPLSLLQYHLLTHDQLDSLARWYHQTVDGERERWMYPGVISRPWCFSHRQLDDCGDEVDLGTKRRRFGKFIGLRGCESPVLREEERERVREKEEEELTERMEREWREALRRAEEEARVQEKVWRGRW